jgi:hypothetical protein
MVPVARVCDHFSDKELYRHGMGTHWVQLAATDVGMMSAVFMSACRSLTGLQAPPVYTQGAIMYRSETIRSLATAISAEGEAVSDATIAKCLALASDAVSGPPQVPAEYKL